MPQLAFETYTPQLVWLAITFVLLYLVMWRVLLPRIGDVLDERQNRIQHDLDEAERLKQEAEAALAQYDAAIADARAKALAQLAEARAAITVELDQRKDKAAAEIDDLTSAAEKRIADAKQSAMAGVRGAAIDTARAVIGRLSGIDVAEPALTAAVDAELPDRG
jgi:F-type H+-transporting ATPase subunit b